MKILIDSREQRPLSFKHPLVTETVTGKLDFGDYACQFEDGHRPPIVFERKSLTDLYGTLGAGYVRFKKEILRSQEANHQLIVIVESTLSQVRQGIDHSIRGGESVVQQLYTLMVRHGIWTVYCSSRAECADYILSFYLACGREYVRTKKGK